MAALFREGCEANCDVGNLLPGWVRAEADGNPLIETDVFERMLRDWASRDWDNARPPEHTREFPAWLRDQMGQIGRSL